VDGEVIKDGCREAKYTPVDIGGRLSDSSFDVKFCGCLFQNSRAQIRLI